MGGVLETVGSGVVWGVGFALAMGAVKSAGGILRGVAKGTVRSGMAVGDWMRTGTQGGRETLQDLYHEARAERQARTNGAGSRPNGQARGSRV